MRVLMMTWDRGQADEVEGRAAGTSESVPRRFVKPPTRNSTMRSLDNVGD